MTLLEVAALMILFINIQQNEEQIYQEEHMLILRYERPDQTPLNRLDDDLLKYFNQ